ncbi:MAG TPA: hypothetical protein VMG38_11985 [Trebonia sp.]|nr:hypothetical protein [Trebonia sp.]
MATVPGGFEGWIAAPGRPFDGPVFVPYGQRSLIMIGANGYGKTRLLNALLNQGTPRVYSRLPPRLAPYLAIARARTLAGDPAAGSEDISALFGAAEAARASDDDHEWWAAELGLPTLRWVVTWEGSDAPATLAAVPADSPLAAPAVVIPAAPRHVKATLPRWTVPDELSPASLASATESAFREWANDVLTACGGTYRISANALIAVADDEQSESLLSAGTAFAREVATRSAARLELLTGLSVALRCLPADRFSWQVRADDGWIPLEWASRAISRWAALTARETLKELAQYAREAAAADSVTDLTPVLRGILDSALIPPGGPRPFASQRSWVALDEPEVHLFASEARHLGEILSEHGHAGRTVIVTHSLDLAAQFVGDADFALFDGPGSFTVDRPGGSLAGLLQRLGKSGPGILAGTRVLYVEGDFDLELITMLHGELLGRHNILLSPMNGVKGAQLAAASVWQRMMTTPFGMMFDSLDQADVDRQWSVVRQEASTAGRETAKYTLRRQIRALRSRSRRVPHEDIELLRLFMAVIDGNLEDRMHLVMHGLSDIFQVMHPSVFGIGAPDWRAAGYDGTISFKEFVFGKTGVTLSDGGRCRRQIEAFVGGGKRTDQEAADKLRSALSKFAAV